MAVRADPDGSLDMARPVLLDEWQLAPQILGAVKRAVDARPGPGSFLITGSVRSDLEGSGWPLTGRALRVQMYGLASVSSTATLRRDHCSIDSPRTASTV
ncbi:AAA family ATPase [Mycobacterium novum]